MKKFPQFRKHLLRFLMLAEVLFALMLIFHAVILITNLDLGVAEATVPDLSSYILAFIGFSMMLMASFYRKYVARYYIVKEGDLEQEADDLDGEKEA